MGRAGAGIAFWPAMIMRLLALFVGLLGSSCQDETAVEEPAWADFSLYRSPTCYPVRNGDTLNRIGARYGVTAAELRAWNGIEGDLIEVDQVLLVWPAVDDEVAAVGTSSKTGSSSRSRRPARPLASPVVLAPATVVLAHAASARTPRAWSRPTDGPRMVRSAGLLGAFDDAGLSERFDPTVAASVSSLTLYGSSVGTADAFARAGSAADRAGKADTSGNEIDRIVTHFAPSGTTIGTGSVRRPSLRMPAAKRCLAGPSVRDVTTDHGVASSRGLDADQIRTALDGFVRHTSSCIPSGSSGILAISTEITVGCDGRVISTRVVDAGSAPSQVASCVAETLTYASFPAHALPDGMSFRYPIHYQL